MIVICRVCKQEQTVSATPEQLKKWQSGMLIQRAMPDVPAEERELLISGTCNDCWQKLFGPEGEEDTV